MKFETPFERRAQQTDTRMTTMLFSEINFAGPEFGSYGWTELRLSAARTIQKFTRMKLSRQKPATGLQDPPALSGAPCPIMSLLPNNIIIDIIKLADGGRGSHEVKLNKCLKELITWGTVEVAGDGVCGNLEGLPPSFSLWVTESYAFLARGVQYGYWEYSLVDENRFTNASWREGGWGAAGPLNKFAEEFRGDVWGVDYIGLPVTNEYE